MHLLITLVGLAISFAVPAFAEEKETVDPQTTAELEGPTKNFIKAIDSNDTAMMSGVFAKDAIFVTMVRLQGCLRTDRTRLKSSEIQAGSESALNATHRAAT
jgi:hypothetical protein